MASDQQLTQPNGVKPRPSIAARTHGCRWLHAASLCAALSACDSSSPNVDGSTATGTGTSGASSQTDSTGSTSSAETSGETTTGEGTTSTATSTTSTEDTTGTDSASTSGDPGSTGPGVGSTGEETDGADVPFGCHGFCHNVVDCDPNFAGSVEECETTCYEPFESQTLACQAALELTNACIAALDCQGYLEWAMANLDAGYPCDTEEAMYFQECSF